ncbi:MAG TPA: PadR family transcriptional regulator [Spirochaetales bacterium]|nr:PadR family transcriptional regulator [Spirochaetales bacterium]
MIDNLAGNVYSYRMPITNGDITKRTFFLGFIRLHLLYHAAQQPIYGLDMIQELRRHGYNLSPGTLYPILHGLEKDGFLESRPQAVNGKIRKYYRITEAGRSSLKEGTEKVGELFREISGEDQKTRHNVDVVEPLLKEVRRD